jgi:hypothetical protein
VCEVNDGELISAQYVIATFMEIGSDIADKITELDVFGNEKGARSLVLNLPLGCPHVGAAVKALKERGFFYGGVMPRWYADCDSLIMQKLYGGDVQWDKTKLFSEKILAIVKDIKNDRP